jgi:hypothetical protein
MSIPETDGSDMKALRKRKMSGKKQKSGDRCCGVCWGPGYAVMQERHLRFKRPVDLSDDWVKHYRTHKPREYGFYMRGELEQNEPQVTNWCSKFTNQFALLRFSAAWRLTPEVRYTHHSSSRCPVTWSIFAASSGPMARQV